MAEGLRLRELRTQRKMKQSDLAKIMGVAPNTVSTWETGDRDPNGEDLKKLAVYFDVSLDYLMGVPNALKKTILESDKVLLNKFNELEKNQQKIICELIDTLSAKQETINKGKINVANIKSNKGIANIGNNNKNYFGSDVLHTL